MTKRIPIIATIVVVVAVATMIGLGVWQLQRKNEKDALVALYIANRERPAIAYPSLGPVRDADLFRASSVNCLEVADWKSSAGKDNKGRSGIRYIAECTQNSGEGPGVLLLAGVADRPDLKPDWGGGAVKGIIVTEADKRSLLEKLVGDDVVLRPMLIASEPVAGLRLPAQPKPEDVTNNHMAYAVQWFLFAFAAAVIYILAVRKRSAEL